jgi:hypothetical protein
MPRYYLFWTTPLFLYVVLSIKAASKFDLSIQGLANRVLVFLILHLSYGWGYLVGIAQFLIIGQRAGGHGVSSSR